MSNENNNIPEPSIPNWVKILNQYNTDYYQGGKLIKAEEWNALFAADVAQGNYHANTLDLLINTYLPEKFEEISEDMAELNTSVNSDITEFKNTVNTTISNFEDSVEADIIAFKSEVNTDISEIEEVVQQANTNANTAVSNSTSAIQTANTAISKSDSAVSIANAASTTANLAKTTAEAISEIAEEAKEIAEATQDSLTNYYTKTETDTLFNNLINGAPEEFDTLKEISDWIANDETGTAALINRVSTLETDMTAAETDIDNLETSVTNLSTTKADKTEIPDVSNFVDTETNQTINGNKTFMNLTARTPFYINGGGNYGGFISHVTKSKGLRYYPGAYPIGKTNYGAFWFNDTPIKLSGDDLVEVLNQSSDTDRLYAEQIVICTQNDTNNTYLAGHIYLIGGTSGAYTATDITPTSEVYPTLDDLSGVAVLSSTQQVGVQEGEYIGIVGNSVVSYPNGSKQLPTTMLIPIAAGENITFTPNDTNTAVKINANVSDPSVTVDSELSTTSENPVQNKVITEALNSKANTIDIPDTSNFVTNSTLANYQPKLTQGTNITISSDNTISATSVPNTLSIGTVTTGEAGSQASATITGIAPNQTLNLVIPKGDTGAQGPTGATPNISVMATTLPAGTPATATRTGSDENPTITFGIPNGAQGVQGPEGPQGPQGEPGPGLNHVSLEVAPTKRSLTTTNAGYADGYRYSYSFNITGISSSYSIYNFKINQNYNYHPANTFICCVQGGEQISSTDTPVPCKIYTNIGGSYHVYDCVAQLSYFALNNTFTLSILTVEDGVFSEGQNANIDVYYF